MIWPMTLLAARRERRRQQQLVENRERFNQAHPYRWDGHVR